MCCENVQKIYNEINNLLRNYSFNIHLLKLSVLNGYVCVEEYNGCSFHKVCDIAPKLVNKPGVYIIFSKNKLYNSLLSKNKIIYIGSSENLYRRLSYFRLALIDKSIPHSGAQKIKLNANSNLCALIIETDKYFKELEGCLNHQYQDIYGVRPVAVTRSPSPNFKIFKRELITQIIQAIENNC